jgi:hypothetical protein
MLATHNREAIVKMTFCLQQVKERVPSRLALFTSHESVHVSNQDNAIAGSGDEDVESLWRGHEADVS